MTELERARGWALFNAPNPEEAALKISSLFTQGADAYVVVRADETEGMFNLVVPIDAQDKPAFGAIVGQLIALAGPATVVTVSRHHPTEPHRAHCFVTDGEFQQFGLAEYYPPGRHPKSPGANPWG